MELAQIIKILWDRKGLLLLISVLAMLAAFATLFKVSPSGVSKRSYSYGSAQTQILIDSPRSSLLDLQQETGPLATRAAVFAAFMRSNAVTDSIAKQMGISPDAVIAQGPYTSDGGTQNIPRPAETRSSEIRNEQSTYRLQFDAQQDLPIVTINAQAPSGPLAVKLADATVRAVRDYVNGSEHTDEVPDGAKTQIRALGPATGGTVQAGEKPLLALLSLLAVLLLGCSAVVGLVGIRRSFLKLSNRNAYDELDDLDPSPVTDPDVELFAPSEELHDRDDPPRRHVSTRGRSRNTVTDAETGRESDYGSPLVVPSVVDPEPADDSRRSGRAFRTSQR